MRRHNYEISDKNYLGLIEDCCYYCWQKEEITDEELCKLEVFIENIERLLNGNSEVS